MSTVDSFDRLLRKVGKLSSRADIVAAWAEWQLDHPDWTPDELGPRLAVLRSLPGLARYVDDATKAKAPAKPQPQAAQNTGVVDEVTLDAWLCDQGCPNQWIPDARRPFGYHLAGPGIYRRPAKGALVLVAGAPVVVVSRSIDADTDAVTLLLAWRYAGRWRSATVPRRQALTRDGLLELAGDGLPVTQATATLLADWLGAIDMELQSEPGQSLGRLGWLPDGSGFAPWSAAVVAPGLGERDALRTYEPSGTWEGWIEGVWRRVAGHRAEIAVLTSLAAPLLHVCRATGWTLDLGFKRGSGKTSAQYAAASVWTSRQGIVTWPKTWAAARSTVEFRTDIPAILDDTKNLGQAGFALAKDLLYQVAGEQAQPLGSAGGGTRATRILRTLVISSGETPIADHLQNAQGAAFRILTLGDRPFPEGHGEGVRGVERATREHYGHAGRRLVEWLTENRHRWDAIADRYVWHVERLAKGASDDAGRIGGRLALLYVAAEVAEQALGIRPSTQVIDDFGAHVRGGTAERDVPREALRHVRSYLAARPSQVVGWVQQGQLKQPYLAAQHMGGALELVVEPLDRILTEGGYVPAEIRRQWADAGWLDRVSKGRDGRLRTSALRSIDGRNTRVVPIRVEVLAGDDGSEVTP